MKNLHTAKTTTEVILVGWFSKCQSIKKVGGRRRFVSGCVFVSQCPPKCYLLVIYKGKQKLSLISGYGPVGDVKLVGLALWGKREYLTFISVRFVAYFSNRTLSFIVLKLFLFPLSHISSSISEVCYLNLHLYNVSCHRVKENLSNVANSKP